RKNIGDCLVNSTGTSAIVILLMAMASIFGNILTLEEIPATIAKAILGISENPIIILLCINILLLIVGMFMEALAAIVILTPILLPIVIQLGVNPVHFGVIMVVNLAIGFITPPVGVNLFVSSGIANLRLERIAKAVMPMLGLMIIILLLITYVPNIVMWLPNLLNN
ncbi:MAG: TRAP transporter large permease subunit, partial [Clostridia bacterium]|nr:TRAP transporter large permease subunit [Clostridia bacterium]